MVTSFAASTASAQVALLRDSELTVFSVEPLEWTASATVPGPVPDSAALAFLSRRVFVHGVIGDRTILSLFELPRLTLVAQIELAAPTRLLASAAGYVLLDRGDTGFIVTCTATNAAVAPLRVDTRIDHAVGLEAAEFVTWSARGAELWSAPDRRISSRLQLDLPPNVTQLGLTGRFQSLWIVGASELALRRLSDGRASKIPLPGTPDLVISDPASSWLLADIERGAHAINSAVAVCTAIDVPVGLPRMIVASVSSAGDAFLVTVDGEHLRRRVLSVQGHEGEIGSIPLARPASEVAAVGTSTSAGREPSERRLVAGSPRVSRLFKGASARPTTTTTTATPSRDPGTDWRSSLLGWAKAVRGESARPLPGGDSPLTAIVRRSSLPPAAARVLHYLYADWLAGHGDVGVAAVLLAPIGNWVEAVGAGVLGRLGLATSAFGRSTLAPALGALLDGRDPLAIDPVGSEDPPPRSEGVFRIGIGDDEELHAVADRLAETLGEVAVAREDAIEVARLEAWLHDRPLLARTTDLLRAPIRNGETVLLAVPPDAPDEPGAPPWWEDGASL